jgi:hypothetical protein
MIIGFLVISSFVSLQGRQEDIVASLAPTVAICEGVGLNLHGKSNQRAACVVLIMVREFLKSMQCKASSLVKSN